MEIYGVNKERKKKTSMEKKKRVPGERGGRDDRRAGPSDGQFRQFNRIHGKIGDRRVDNKGGKR